MSSNDIAIQVQNISKLYQIYDNPRDRLKQFFYPKMQRIVGAPPKKYFNEFWALNDINFEIKKGECAGIIGRNGSGKSTLLQIITGTLTPTTGIVKTSGRIAALLELGSGFNPEFTGRENIYLNGALLGLSNAQINNKFDLIAGFADIGPHLEQPVKTYSSGMLVRLAFAVQVQLEPDILIVDEALAVGDALFQKRCFQQIERLTSNGVTLLFVSHDQESVRTLTNKSILLSSGNQIAQGLSSEVLLAYRKLLHEEETSFYSKLTEEVKSKAEAKEKIEDVQVMDSDNQESLESTESIGGRANKLSFGEGSVVISKVEILDKNSLISNVFHPGETVKIRIHCKALEDIQNINVGLRIRNKEGVKIYSWGTLNQDMLIRYEQGSGSQFWEREFKANEDIAVDFEFECDLGTNLYEVQASVSLEETPNYLSQRILHWKDEAAFFHVQVLRDSYFFGGLTDLRMKANW